jgi:hypothetical protein
MTGEYNRQTRDRVTLVREPEETGGIGAMLTGAGRGLARVNQVNDQAQEAIATSEHRLAMAEKQRAQSSAIVTGMGDLARAEAAIRAKLDDLRNKAAPGAAGHSAAAREIVTSTLMGITDGLPDDPEVRDRLTPSIVRLEAQSVADEEHWARVEKGRAEGENAQVWVGTRRNSLFNDPSPARLDVALDETEALFSAIDAPPALRERAATGARSDLVRSYLDGMLAKGMDESVAAQVNSSALDAYLTGDGEKARYLARAANLAEQRQREAKAAQVDQQGQVRDAVRALKLRMDAGGLASPDEFRAVRAAAKGAALGVDVLTEIDIMQTEADTARRYEGRPVEALRRDSAALSARIASGKAGDGDRIAAKVVTGLLDRAETDQADKLRAMIGQGVPGKMQALAAIQGDADTRFAVAEKLQPGMGVLMGLDPIQRKFALEGADIRKARAADFGKEADIDRDFKAFTGRAMAVRAGQFDDVRDAAWNIMTANLNAKGKAGYDAGLFKTAIRLATGARQRAGDGALVGGINQIKGQPVQLPDWMTPADFEARMARYHFSGAVRPDGSAVAKADILANLTPEWVGDDARGLPMYRFVDGNGHVLQGQDKQDYRVTVLR